MVIALFYTETLNYTALTTAFVLVLFLIALNLGGVKDSSPICLSASFYG